MPIGPSWELIAMAAVSLVVTLVAVYQRGMASRIDRLESAQTRLNEALLREYHSKQDVREMMDGLKAVVNLFHVDMKASFKELRDRFDKFENLYGR